MQDLIEEDVMILDTYSEVYVWIGRGANEEEKRESLKIAQEYITSDPSGRDLDATLLLQVKNKKKAIVLPFYWPWMFCR